jgi:hypothetical protein
VYRTWLQSEDTQPKDAHTRPKNWDDDNYSGLLAPTSKGERLIIVHAGGRAGFISNALLIYKSRQKTGDYHNEMDSKNYARWLKTMLIPNLPLKSILVIDNASYHNIQTDKPPTASDTSECRVLSGLEELQED